MDYFWSDISHFKITQRNVRDSVFRVLEQEESTPTSVSVLGIRPHLNWFFSEK